MTTKKPDVVPFNAGDAPEHTRQSGVPPFELWKGSCLERLCGPDPSEEEQQNWYRWCQYHCTEHGVCKQKDPPGPL